MVDWSTLTIERYLIWRSVPQWFTGLRKYGMDSKILLIKKCDLPFLLQMYIFELFTHRLIKWNMVTNLVFISLLLMMSDQGNPAVTFEWSRRIAKRFCHLFQLAWCKKSYRVWHKTSLCLSSNSQKTHESTRLDSTHSRAVGWSNCLGVGALKTSTTIFQSMT